MNSIILNIFSIATLLFSVFSITSKNPVVSILFLIGTFVLASCFIIFLGINFLGITYIIVYVGAIAVLFLFIIMMINIKLTEILESGVQYSKTLPLGLLIVSFFIFLFLAILPNIFIHWKLFYTSSSILPTFNNTTSNGQISYVITDNYFKELQYFDNPDALITNLLQIDNVGFTLYTYGAFLLIVCSIILLLAMFSAIIISTYSDNK
jgi:NADH-ubiquinone oxidoreductase chain 6